MQKYPKQEKYEGMLWESNLLEEKRKGAFQSVFVPQVQSSRELSILEVDSNKNSRIGTRGSSIDTEKKIKKSSINQTIIVFSNIENSVKDWKERGNRLREVVIREMEQKIMGHFSFPQGAWILGFVLGEDGGISTSMRQYLKITGMSHVTSASGYNIGLVLSLTQPVISCFWARKRAGAFLICMIWIYIWVAGSTASLWRAGLMSSLALIGTYWQFRQTKPIRLLAISFLFLAVCNRPMVESISFQLSASATLGLLLFLPWINQNLGLLLMGLPIESKATKHIFTRVEKLFSVFWEAFITTVAAQVFTIPIVWHHFQEFSLVSFFSNTFLLWLTPLITIGGFLGVGLSIVPLASGLLDVVLTPISWFLWLLLEIFTQGLAFFGHYKNSLIKLPSLPWLGVGLWWLFFIVLSWQLSRNQDKHQNRKLNEIYAC